VWHVRLELRNVVANYPFEKSHRFAGILLNSGHRDNSRLSCGVGRRSSGLMPDLVGSPALARDCCAKLVKDPSLLSRPAGSRSATADTALPVARAFRNVALRNLLRDPNWLLGNGFRRSRCWLGYHSRVGNRLRNIDRFRAGLMSTNQQRSLPK
jgi:hypothetical protein